MKIKVNKILALEGFRFSGYVSIDGRNVYMCFNECAYPHMLLKDHVIKTFNNLPGDLDGHLKFYTRTIGGKLVIDHIANIYTNRRVGFYEAATMGREELNMIRSKIEESLRCIDIWFSYNPEVDINQVIVWDRFELKNFYVDNLKDYYSGHEMTYDNLCD